MKSNLHEFDFQGGLDILDDSVQNLILQEAITQAYEKLCEEDYESYKLLKNAFADKTLNEITDNLYKFMRSLPFPERWIAEVHKNFTDDRIFDSFIKDNICVAQKKLKEAFSMYEVFEEYACRKEIEGIPFIKHIKMNETADSDRELLHRLRKLLESGDIDTIAKSDWKFSTIKRFPTNKAFNASLDDDIRIKFKDNYAFCASYRNKYKDIVAKITDMFNNTKLIMKENMLESDRIFTVLCRVCELSLIHI